MLQRSLKTAGISGVLYLFIITVLFKLNIEFESAYTYLDWIFRISVIVTVSFSIILLKKKQGDKLTIGEGFKEGSLVSFFLAGFLAFGMALFCNFIQSDYSDNIKKNYKDMQYAKMMNEYVYEYWKKDTITQGAMDTVNVSLNKFIDQRNFFFTNKGQVLINYIYCLFYGLITALTISMLSRKE